MLIPIDGINSVADGKSVQTLAQVQLLRYLFLFDFISHKYALRSSNRRALAIQMKLPSLMRPRGTTPIRLVASPIANFSLIVV